MTYHAPALVNEVARLAAGRSRGVDCTAGGGGHTAVLLDAGLSVLAVDRDPEAVEVIAARFAGRDVTVRQGRFADPAVLALITRFEPDLVLLDLGVSSRQVDTDGRGFSFRPGVPLDMRMDAAQGPTAADFLASWSEADLARIFRDFGDEPRARNLAREIVRRRTRAALTHSDDLVNAIRAVLGPRSGPADFARLFQAVRMAVNDELEQLREGLPALREALQPGGLVAAITYHSGEDRIVKHAFREWARSCICPPRQPVCTCRGRPLGRVETKKAIAPTAEEMARNPRVRSAKLRAFRTADATQG